MRFQLIIGARILICTALIGLATGCGGGESGDYVEYDSSLGELVLLDEGDQTCTGYDSSTCLDGYFCLASQCEPSRKRKLDLTILNLSAGARAPDGGEWEEFELNTSDPDFTIDVSWSTSQGTGNCQTSEIESYDPYWNQLCETRVASPKVVEALGVYGAPWLNVSLWEWDINGWGNDVGEIEAQWRFDTLEALDELTEAADRGETLVLTASGKTKLSIRLELQ